MNRLSDAEYEPDESLEQMLRRAAEPPRGLAARITRAVHADARARRPRFRLHPVMIGAAAALVILASGVVWMMSFRDGESPAVADASVPVQERAAVPENAAVPGHSAVSVPQAVRLVGVDGQAGESDASPASPRPVEPEVHHIWGVPSVGASEFLEKSARKRGIVPLPVADEGTEHSGKAYEFVISDRELQSLTDELAAGKWRLYSTQYPLPERERDVVLTGRPVRFRITLVPLE